MIIGGGLIGLELGRVYRLLGAEVSVIEYMDRIIPGMDRSLSRELQKVLKKQGVKLFVSHNVTAVKSTAKAVTLTAENKKGDTVEFKGDYCLVSVSRKSYTNGLNAAAAGVAITANVQI